MAHRTQFLRHEIFKVWLLYLVAGLAFIPAGIICVLLLRRGISQPVSLLISLSVGSCLVYVAWRFTNKKLNSQPKAFPIQSGAKPLTRSLFYSNPLVVFFNLVAMGLSIGFLIANAPFLVLWLCPVLIILLLGIKIGGVPMTTVFSVVVMLILGSVDICCKLFECEQ